MRLAFISASAIPSRAANSIEVMKVCQAFSQLGHELRLWVPGPNPHLEWSEIARQYGLQSRFDIEWVASWTALRRYDFAFRAVIAAWRWKAEYVYTWPFQAAALSGALGLKTMVEVHDAPRGRLGPWLLRVFLKSPGAVRVLPITEAMRSWIEQMYALELRPPFSVITPSGVDLERFEDLPGPAAARTKLGWPQVLTVGYTGHLYPGRGMELMLGLAERHPDLRFVWAGGEPEAVRSWREEIEQRGLSNLSLLGFVPNEKLPLYQAACDILLLPHEQHVSASSGGDIARFTSPMKLFEYLAAGRAIMASDLPVLREVLSEQVAVIVPPEDIEAWSGALTGLSRDSERRETLGMAASELAGQYSWIRRAERSIAGLADGGV